MKKEMSYLFSAPRETQILAALVFMIGIHSLVLGIFIFFFTELFYQIFFQSRVESLFFVRQSGLFLFCLGLFYFAPLIDFRKRHRLVLTIIATKVLAVVFLITHSSYAPWPPIILVAAILDGLMGLVLMVSYHRSLHCLEQNETCGNV